MNFELNPCIPVLAKAERDGCNINDMSDVCYGICSAYDNPTGCKDKCKSLINEKKKALGKNNCNLTRPMRPVKWNQVPHYFPRLLKKTNNMQNASQMCYNLCEDSKYPNSCREMCDMDAMAVRTSSNNKQKNTKQRFHNGSGESPNAYFWIGFVIMSIFMILILTAFVSIIYIDWDVLVKQLKNK